MGKESAPAAPDYTPIANASEKSAELYNKLGQDTLDFYKDQYNTYWPYVKDYLNEETLTTSDNRDRAGRLDSFYNDTYKPIETKFANAATGYATPARATERAGAAMADVASSYESSRQSALRNLESYGIDPSQTRYGALDLSSRVAQAAATAAAGTQSRLNTEATGLALEGEAINTGRGYASNVSQAYDTSTKAGSAGTSSANNLYSSSASALGTPSSYFNSSNSANSVASNALNYGYSNASDSVKTNNSNNASLWGGIGKLAGGALGFFM